MRERNAKDNERAVAFADTMSRFVNGGFGRDAEDAAALMLQDHPTLQQAAMKFCAFYILGMANKKHGVDGRNQMSVDLAKKMIGTMDKYDMCLPCI